VIQLAYKIKDARAELKMSQEELAKKAGVSRQTISGLESGACTVTITDTLIKIAHALGKNVSDIFLP
jgi:putative transcriptional regulator